MDFEENYEEGNIYYCYNSYPEYMLPCIFCNQNFPEHNSPCIMGYTSSEPEEKACAKFKGDEYSEKSCRIGYQKGHVEPK